MDYGSVDDPDVTVPMSPLLEEVASSSSGPISVQDRKLFYFFATVVGGLVLGMLWLALRSSTSPLVCRAMDFAFQLGLGGLFALAGFGLLLLFPFRFTELLSIVIVLSILMRLILGALQRLMTSGIWATFYGESASGAGLGLTLEICMMAASVFLAGAALGLRHCLVLKIENTSLRVLAVVSGMIALPGAAGFFVFPIMVLRDALSLEGVSPDSSIFLLGWAVSVVSTVVNAYFLIRGMTLRD